MTPFGVLFAFTEAQDDYFVNTFLNTSYDNIFSVSLFLAQPKSESFKYQTKYNLIVKVNPIMCALVAALILQKTSYAESLEMARFFCR